MKIILAISITLLCSLASAQTSERELARYSSSKGTIATVNSSVTVGDTTIYLSIQAKDPSYSAFTVHSSGIVVGVDVEKFLEIFENEIDGKSNRNTSAWDSPYFTMKRSGKSIVIDDDRGMSGVMSLKTAKEVASFIRENLIYFNI